MYLAHHELGSNVINVIIIVVNIVNIVILIIIIIFVIVVVVIVMIYLHQRDRRLIMSCAARAWDTPWPTVGMESMT